MPEREPSSMEERKPSWTWPAFYATVWPLLQREARERGYCLALHGSLVRDLDVVAVPWVEDAVSAEDLVAALCEATGALLLDHRCPVSKPHGRREWSLYFESTSYVDLSVLPVQDAADELARLRAEVARLTAQRDAAEARAERYREALEKIAQEDTRDAEWLRFISHRALTEGAGDNSSTGERPLREILRTRTCPVHLLPEPCEICAAYIAGGL